MTETDHFDGGIATLDNNPVDGIHDEAPFKVSGVALPERTVVNGGQNTDHFYTAETLQDAADLLEGKQIVKNFHEINGQANADQVIGTITNAGYQKGVGLVFEGEISDEDIAEKVELGYLDVSPTVARELGEFDDSMGAQQVKRVSGFRDLAVVANGQPGAEITVGGNAAITALGMDALARGFDVLASIDDLSEGDIVSWGSSGDRPAYGVVERTVESGQLDDEIDGDVTIEAPAALIEVHEPGSDGWEATGTMVGHKPGTLEIHDEFPNPDTLQSDGPSLDEGVDVPERVQNAAQAALDADEEGLIPDSCGTGTGTTRARALAENDVTVADFLTRRNDMTPIPAYLNSHAEDATTSDPPTQWGESQWSSCGNVGLARWGWYVEWFTDTANSLASDRGEQEPYSRDTLETHKEVAGVRFQGTRDGDLDESAINAEETALSDHYLYGDGENKEDYSYPVVDAEGYLRKANVNDAHELGCRGQCPSDETHDENLRQLAQEFDTVPEWATDDDTMTGVILKETNPRDGNVTLVE